MAKSKRKVVGITRLKELRDIQRYLSRDGKIRVSESNAVDYALKVVHDGIDTTDPEGQDE